MPNTTVTGGAALSAADEKYVKWVGKTKAGKEIMIELPKALCRSNIEWTFAEKDDVTAELDFEGLYEDANLAKGEKSEPWKLTYPTDQADDAGQIILGAGLFYVGTNSGDAKAVALTRGGGSFTVEREYRDINADGDPGAVSGRVVKEMGRPHLKLTALQWLTRVADIYPAVTTVPGK